MKKILMPAMLILLLVLFGCESAPGMARATAAPSATAIQTPTPEPLVVDLSTPAPIITMSELSLAPLPQGYAIASVYTAMAVGDSTVYAFTDTEGKVQYRAYADYDILHDAVVSETIGGLYPINLIEDEGGVTIELAEDAEAATAETEPLGQCVPMDVPEGTRIRSAYVKEEQTGLYSTGDGCIVFGAFRGGEPAFYPADASGKMTPGALAYEGEVIIPAYYPEDAPKIDGKYLLIVYINTQSVVAFHAENGEWVQRRAMICSTGRSPKYNPTPHGRFTVPEIYRYKKLGFKEGDYWYSQYASRITTNYLFHSTPIWEQAGRDYNVGKTMVRLSQYEKLGQPASGGCVRLTVIDAKWIYDNCGVGTYIRIGDWDGPTVEKPPAIIYEAPYMTGEDMGWDPTDPDPENPYHAIYGILD